MAIVSYGSYTDLAVLINFLNHLIDLVYTVYTKRYSIYTKLKYSVDNH